MPVDQGLDRAVQSYRDFLQQAPDSTLAPEAMRRLADLKIEKEFGIHGDGKPVGLPASGIPPPNAAPQLALPRGMDGDRARAGPLEAIKLYDRSEEHTSELQSRLHLVCRLLLEKKKQFYDVIDADVTTFT